MPWGPLKREDYWVWPGDCRYPPPPEPPKPMPRVEPAHTGIRELACAIAAEVRTDYGVQVEVGDWRRFDEEKWAYLLPIEANGHYGSVWVCGVIVDGYADAVRNQHHDGYAAYVLKRLEKCLRKQMVEFVKPLTG